ncbi:MAG: DUF4238 domain-containing protein [Patescibacteria group bacterium]
MPEEYKNHHYVPQWYQKKFMLPSESELFYLDMKPNTFMSPDKIPYHSKALIKQGSKKCFVEKDLYTTKIQSIESKDIEKYFFGKIDRKGQEAVEYFEKFAYPLKDWKTYFEDIMIYMSTQKLRTPKGLTWLKDKLNTDNKYNILSSMTTLGRMNCAIWTESVWLIADASNSETKFIISDHPITIYNRECGPRSQQCRNANDPDIFLQGSHTIFPLSLDKILILTNLSWVRNPYQSATKPRPNSNLFRNAIFKFTDIQTMRHLNEQEVREINFIIKNRAFRHIAGAKKDWLYPEKYVSKSNWNKYGEGYLLMPDPRPIHLGGEIFWGGGPGPGGSMDEYGRVPEDPDYNKETNTYSEHRTLNWFKGEFAHLFGPHRRGRSFQAMSLDPEKDDDKFHQYHLNLQKKKYKYKNKYS